jgi:hypothetical protein
VKLAFATAYVQIRQRQPFIPPFVAAILFPLWAAKHSFFTKEPANVTSHEALLLLRFLACIINPNSLRPSPHPLKHQLISRYLPNYDNPTTEYNFDFKDHIVNPIRMLQVLGIDPFANNHDNTWVFEAIRHRLNNNKRGIKDLNGYVVQAVYPRLSMFNHSCELNIKLYGDETCVVANEARYIKEGRNYS